MTDQASYRSTNQAAWANFQVFPNDRLEIFVNSVWNDGKATIYGFNNDSSKLLAQPAGLDFAMMSAAFAGFSDLGIRQMVHSLGFNYRATDRLVLNSALEYHDYKDSQPYLYDTTGRRTAFYAGINWMF